MSDITSEYRTYDGIIVGISPEAVKTVALETGDWLLGTVQGCFNEKMTVSQIVVDALIGMVPLVGDVTAVRDLIAVILGLCTNPRKREQAMEWALLVVLVLALVPVAGGVVKGVGRLALQGAKTAGKKHAVLKDIIMFLNRMGEGNAVKYIKELNVMQYQRATLAKFKEATELLHRACDKIIPRFWIPRAIKDRLYWFQSCLSELHRLGSKMIPEGFKELNTHLKEIQKAVYQGEFHIVSNSGKVVTREAEARLAKRAGRLARREKKYSQNRVKPKDEDELAKYYEHKPGWPEMTKKLHDDGYYEYIAACHGPIKATTVLGPKRIKRVIHLEKNRVSGYWWHLPGERPKNAQEWRTGWAVLDEFNEDGYIVTCLVPEKKELKVWESQVSSQIGEKIPDQYLEGGKRQLFLNMEISGEEEALLKESLRAGKPFKASNGLEFSIEKTGWADASGVWGFHKGEEILRIERLHRHERQSKRLVAAGRLSRGVNGDGNQDK